MSLKSDMSQECHKSDRSIQKTINLKEDEREKSCVSGTLTTHNENLKQLLRERYQCVFEGTSMHGKAASPTPLKKIYIELYITEGFNEHLNNKHEVRQLESSRKTPTWDTPINCNDIFKPLTDEKKHIRTVVTKGVAGIGKTISVQKFILDWAEGKTNQDVHIFPLPFRELNLMRDKKCSLIDLLHLFFINELNESFLQSKNICSVFIFDGLDECRLPLDFKNNESLSDPTKATSVDILLTNLIKGNLLPSAQIWITTRPASVNRIPNECIDRMTEVRGFSDPQKEEYFRKRFSDESLASRIITHLKSLRSLYIMCQIPVFCWISATVLERIVTDSGWEKVPKSLTQMYTCFLITQIRTKRAKYCESKEEDSQVIFKLGKLAYEQLEKGNLIFYEEDLRECEIDVKEGSIFFGLCTQIFREEFGFFQRKIYSFVHLSIQEHLAALYVFLSFHNYNKNVFDPQQESDGKAPVTMSSLLRSAIDKASESISGHLDLLLRFLMGFSLKSNQTLLQDLLTQSTSDVEIEETKDYLKEKIRKNICAQKSVVFFHCLNELSDCSIINDMQTCLRNGTLKEKQPSTEFWSALTFSILTSDDNLDVSALSNYGGSDESLLRLLPMMTFSDTARLNNCNITMKGCAALTAALHNNSTLKELDLSHNHVQDPGIKVLCTGFQSYDLRKKKLRNASLEEKQRFLSSILNVKPSCETQDTLEWDVASHRLCHFLEVHFQTHGVLEFAGLQHADCKVEILRLEKCGITKVGCEFLASILGLISSHLRELDLSKNEIGDSGVKVLLNVSKTVPLKLKILKLRECGITENSCAALVSVLSSESSCLRELDLSVNDLKDSGAKFLSEGLESPHCKLQSLVLSSCNVTEEGFAVLHQALQSNPSCQTEPCTIVN